MEVVLDLYQSEHTEEEPLVCMDEAAIAIPSHLNVSNDEWESLRLEKKN
jgi:hypothetical protein